MIKWIAILLASLLFLSAVSIGVVRYERRREWATAYRNAADAYDRAWNDRDSEPQSYEPRWLDFEKARDLLTRLQLPDDRSEQRNTKLRQCAQSLRFYREAPDKTLRVVQSAGQRAEDCVTELEQ